MTTKKVMNESIWFLNGLILGVATILLGLALFSNWAKAATYNVLFNNVEQGANSTAHPSVNVSNGKATKTAGTDTDAAAAPATEVPLVPPTTPEVPAATAGTSQTALTQVARMEEPSFRPMRVGFLANNLSADRLSTSGSVGGALSLGYFPLRDFGLNTFVGTTENAPHAFYGGEIEFVPVRASIFGWKDALEVKGMVGASTLGRDLGTLGERGSIHAGLGSTINFGDRYGLTAEIRTNLSNRSDYKYWLADAGLVVRF